MSTHTELLLQLTSERRQSALRERALRAEIHDWQQGCRRAELYAEWIKQKLANVLLAIDDETKERMQREQDEFLADVVRPEK